MVFSIPTFTTVGDEYDKNKVVDERNQGKNFVAVGPKSGQDGLFQKTFLSIHEGDKFVDPGIAEKRYKMEKAKKNLTSNGFKYANPSPKPSGKGDYFGTFNLTPVPHETDFVVPRKGEAPPRKHQELRPIYTNPPKKGTYGFPGTTLSDFGQDYIACFSIDRLPPRPKDDRPAFRTIGRLGATFDEGMGTGISQCYKMTKPMEKLKRKPAPEKKKVEFPWRPAGPIPKSAVYVEYREDPFDHYDPREAPKKRGVDHERASWRPGGTTNSSWYTTSIAFKKL